MVCTSVKQGYDCFFMSKKGCQFNGGICHPIVEQCEGCQKAIDFPTGKYCLGFPEPAAKWRIGKCNMATHMKETSRKANGKLNPLKASKRSGH
ncbi:MAG: PxxKW family cysteine-rich protein [Thermodesulfobacteriota bacterium]|nr:PxxKW family cysteine-rich protein [Thermodesulfobacteriota bacterium]